MTIGGHFDIETKEKNILKLENEMLQPGFWDNPKTANKKSEQLSHLKKFISDWTTLKKDVLDVQELITLTLDSNDTDLVDDISSSTIELQERYNKMELTLLMSGKYDENNCYLSINAGAGGTESCDWVSMLYRMYLRWAEENTYKVELIDYLEGDEAGIKNLTIHVIGKYAFGNLISETGVHRLIRISPFDTNKRRHTSFASVYVFPEVDDDVNVEVNQSDLKIDTYRAQGAGGQHINTTDSAVRITHLPTGIVVQCQNQRSQLRNKEEALKVLKMRLFQHYEKEKMDEIEKQQNQKMEISFGSQIRTYTFQPYILVKDHRMNFETGNGQAVMDGKLNGFINAFLQWRIKNKN